VPPQDPEYLKKLEPVAKQLEQELDVRQGPEQCQKDGRRCQRVSAFSSRLAPPCPQIDYDAKKLGTLVASIMQFQEDVLGKDVSARCRRGAQSRRSQQPTHISQGTQRVHQSRADLLSLLADTQNHNGTASYRIGTWRPLPEACQPALTVARCRAPSGASPSCQPRSFRTTPQRHGAVCLCAQHGQHVLRLRLACHACSA
jgi:hypothetical protein